MESELHRRLPPSPVSVFLDQSRWVDLKSAEVGEARGASERALRLLRSAKERGLVRLPLAAVHYLETWHRNSWEDRHALGRLMLELSDVVTIAPLEVVTKAELQAHCALRTGKPGPSLDDVVFGHGVDHAFDSDTGRFVFVETLPASIYAKPGEHAPIELFTEIRQSRPDLYEWMSIAGPPDDWDAVPEEFRFETRPEHLRGDDWVERENTMREQLAKLGLSRRLRDALVVEDITGFLDDLNSVAFDYGIDPHRLMGDPLVGPRELIAALPSRYTLVEFEFARLRDSQYRPKQHDRTDLISHAVAVPYCDVVVTERRMASLVRQGRLDERFGTIVFQGLDELSDLIEVLLDSQTIGVDHSLTQSGEGCDRD